MKELDALMQKVSKLPWYVHDGMPLGILRSQDAAYITLAANNLPKLVEALEICCDRDCPATCSQGSLCRSYRGRRVLSSLRSQIQEAMK